MTYTLRHPKWKTTVTMTWLESMQMLRAYLPSWSICSPHVADGQQRQEKCEFGAAIVKLVQPSAYRVGPLLINCSVFDSGIFHFSDTLQTKTARLDNLYHLAILCQWVVNWLCELGSVTVRARGKSGLRDTALLSFTHRAILRLVTRTVLTLEDKTDGEPCI